MGGRARGEDLWQFRHLRRNARFSVWAGSVCVGLVFFVGVMTTFDAFLGKMSSEHNDFRSSSPSLTLLHHDYFSS
jgi:hypothetical protein